MKHKIAVIGAGAWGTALASLAAEGGRPVEIFARKYDVIDDINNNNQNSAFVPGINLNRTVTAKHMDDFADCDAKYIIWSVPTQFTREVARKMKPSLDGRTIITASKGIEIDSGKLVLQIMQDELDAELAILSGPSFANEVTAKKPTAVVIAAVNPDIASFWQKELSCNYFRAYTSTDTAGLEVGGALKNVIAIAAGISDGLMFDHNTRMALITRGLAEIKRFGVAYGAKMETFLGLAGLGDLILTSTVNTSRNRQVGIRLAEGFTIEEIASKRRSVAEGVFTAKAVHFVAERMQISMPICDEVYNIIYNHKAPMQSVKDLLSRPLKAEDE